jgi:hypothetical protein
VRGGLDDALEKLARRDELRRRTAGEATGTPPAVQELVEAIAAVVGRNPKLTVTVGVEGVGDPTLLHFTYEDGVVQVSADRSVATRPADAPPAPRHADFDFDIDLEEPVEEPSQPSYPGTSDAGQDTRRISYDDRNRYDPGTGYAASGSPAGPSYAEHILYAEHPYEGQRRYAEPDQPTPSEEPPPVRTPGQRGLPTPLPEPIPLKVDSREAEQAAKRLAALLRDNPTLLRPSHQD